MADPISNTDDVIDSRDIIARIEELEIEHADECSFYDDGTCRDDSEGHEHTECPDGYEHEELEDLQALAREAQDQTASWHSGALLIRDSYFEQHAEEEATEMAGGIPSDMVSRWPFNHIDWEKAAEELQSDYARVSFNGTDYWVQY